MPPELKKSIESMSEMTCENCVFSVKSWQEDTFLCRKELEDVKSDFAQITRDSFFCSHGQWLWLGVWSSVADDRPTIHLFHYEELYEMFARGW